MHGSQSLALQNASVSPNQIARNEHYHNRKIQRQISTLVVGLFATDLCILDLPRQEVKGGPVEGHQTISFSYEVVELIPTAFTPAGAKYLGQKALSRRIIAVFLEYYLSF